MLRTLSAAAAAVTCMLAAPAANAATMEVPLQRYALVYTASAGETNNVTVSSEYVAATRTVILTLRDAGVGQIAIDNQSGEASPCRTASTPNAVICTMDLRTTDAAYPESTFILEVSVKDGNDRVTFDASTSSLVTRPETPVTQPFWGWVFGGTGSDTLTDLGDGELRPELHGEDGNDSLRGGPGDNDLIGGSGADVFFGYEGADDMIGGPGNDSVTYRDGREPGGVIVNNLEETASTWGPTVKVSGNAWDYSSSDSSSQGDVVTGMEYILGTAYNDVLIGNSAANVLTGSGGKDTLYGMGGNDTLVVTGAPGRLYGGAGNDTLNARNGAADTRLDCGPDTDVANLDLVDTGWIGCESTIRQ